MRKVKIQVPTKLSDIKLSQYQKFLRVTKDVEDDRIINNRIVAVFCNLTDNIVKNMNKHHFDEILLQISNLLNSITNDVELIRTFRYENETYGFIPCMDDMTVGELADIDSFITDWQTMDKVMGILYRPTTAKVGDNYLILDYEKWNGKSIDPPLDVALSAYFFLNNLLIDLLNYIPSSIGKIVNQDQRSKSLVENGVGLKQFMDSLNAVCLSMSRTLQQSNTVKHYIG